MYVQKGAQRPSSFLARLTSALATSVVPLIRRVTLEGFFSRLWRLPVFSRRILPEPVTRKRLPAPEWLLFLGIFGLSLVAFVVRVGMAGPVRPAVADPVQASISGS